MAPESPKSFQRNPNKSIRCFLGLPLNSRALLEAIPRTRGLEADFRFSDPSLWHLTLAFMPNLPESEVESLIEKCSTILNQFKPIHCVISGFDAFPSQAHPEVLWVALSPNQPFFELESALRPCVPSDTDKRFHPHITIARVRRRGELKNSRTELQELFSKQLKPIPLQFDSVCLYQSFLDSSGPRYEIRHQWPPCRSQS